MPIVIVSILFCFFLYNVQSEKKLAPKGKNTTQLITDLFADWGYNRYAPSEQPKIVGLYAMLEEIKAINDVSEILVTRIRTHVTWTDSRLKWNPGKYGGLQSISILDTLLWKPDIALVNGVSVVTKVGTASVPVLVSYKGNIVWMTTNIFESKCTFDLEKYPYDSQRCEIRFGTFASPGFYIHFKNMNCTILNKKMDTSTWSLESSDQYVTFQKYYGLGRNSGQQELTCVYHIKRKPSFYVMNILLPLVFLSIINPFTFVIPYGSGEKISFAMTLFLTFAVFITIVMDKVPVNSDKTSYLQLYLLSQVAITVLNLITIVIQIRLNVLVEMVGRGAVDEVTTDDRKIGQNSEEKMDCRKSSVGSSSDNVSLNYNYPRDRPRMCARSGGSVIDWLASKIDTVAFVTVALLQVICNAWFYVSLA